MFPLAGEPVIILVAKVRDSRGLRRSVILLTAKVCCSPWLRGPVIILAAKVCGSIGREYLWSYWPPRYSIPVRSEDLWSCLIAKQHMLFLLTNRACDLLGCEGMRIPFAQICDPVWLPRKICCSHWLRGPVILLATKADPASYKNIIKGLFVPSLRR